MDIHGGTVLDAFPLLCSGSIRLTPAYTSDRYRYYKTTLRLYLLASLTEMSNSPVSLAPRRYFRRRLFRKYILTRTRLVQSHRTIAPFIFSTDIFRSRDDTRTLTLGDSHRTDLMNHEKRIFLSVLTLLIQLSWTWNRRESRECLRRMAPLFLRIHPNRLPFDASLPQYFGGCDPDIHRCIYRKSDSFVPYGDISDARSSLLVFRTSRRFFTGIYFYDTLCTLYPRIFSRKSYSSHPGNS